MSTKQFITLWLGGLLGSGVWTLATAQTARIAHFSHSGSLATLANAAALDNFGNPRPYSEPIFSPSKYLRNPPPDAFIYDSIRLTSDTSALEYGRWRERYNNPDRVRMRRFMLKATNKDKREMVRYYRKYHPEVKLIGFGTIRFPKNCTRPSKTKAKAKRKEAIVGIAMPSEPPQHPGVWLGVVLILGLSGVGWLLGEERPQLA